MTTPLSPGPAPKTWDEKHDEQHAECAEPDPEEDEISNHAHIFSKNLPLLRDRACPLAHLFIYCRSA
jgi:hypothetical protein